MISVYAGIEFLSRDLSLRFRNFFNKDPRHGLPASVGVSLSTPSTVTNPESYPHLAFVNIVAVPLDISDAVQILTVALPHVHNTVNLQGSCTFSTVESKIPAFATRGASVDPEGTSPVNMEGCVRKVLEENTVLNRNNNSKNNKIEIGN